jgi:hypothetical protein
MAAKAAEFPFGSQQDMAAAYSRLQNPEGSDMETPQGVTAGRNRPRGRGVVRDAITDGSLPGIDAPDAAG